MKLIKVIVSFVMIVCLTGCWGMKEIQQQIYITAIGLDFKQGDYYVYFQALSFSNIAHQESGSGEEMPVLIGTGVGDSLEEAFDYIQKNSPSPLYFGHISTIFFSPSMLKEHLSEFLDYAGRTEIIRYNTGIFSIQENMREAMALNGFFGKSPAFSFTFNPGDVLENDSFIPTITYQNLVQRYEQPVGSILIPTLKIDGNQWEAGKKNKQVIKASGGYLLTQKKVTGWLNLKGLEGINWFNDNSQNLYIVHKERNIGVKVIRPHLKIKVIQDTPTPRYKIHIKVPVAVQENLKDVSQKELKDVVRKEVKKQINTTFQKGLQLNTDALNLSEKAYRFHSHHWSERELNNITPSSIESIKVNVILENTSAYK